MIISVFRRGELFRWVANVGTSYDVGVAPTRDMAWDAAWDVATEMVAKMKKAAWAEAASGESLLVSLLYQVTSI